MRGDEEGGREATENGVRSEDGVLLEEVQSHVVPRVPGRVNGSQYKATGSLNSSHSLIDSKFKRELEKRYLSPMETFHTSSAFKMRCRRAGGT